MIEIGPEEKEILNHEIEALIRSLGADSTSHRDYAQLLAAIDSGIVPDNLAQALEQVLEITLSAGRIRDVYGPQQEQQLLQLYNRTPAGASLRQHIRQVNQSLEALNDQKVERLSFSLKVPGAYRLAIHTDRCEITLRIDRQGVSVDQLAVGL